jgi:hypothetical protein
VAALPQSRGWLFWDVEAADLDTELHVDAIIPRVLERGVLDDVHWLIDTYGLDRIHRFLQDVGSTELSPRTIAFWRALFDAEDESWALPPAWRKDSAAPWPG